MFVVGCVLLLLLDRKYRTLRENLMSSWFSVVVLCYEMD
jgi:hypothetical protein